MLKNKRGALETSVNTIIVIVIGLTLLILGLTFVRGIFGKQTDLSDKAFEEANRELDSLGGQINELLTVSPDTIRINAGDTSGFVVLVKNVEQNTYSGVTANIKTSENALANNVKCEFSDGSDSKSLRTPLGSGTEDRLRVRV